MGSQPLDYCTAYVGGKMNMKIKASIAFLGLVALGLAPAAMADSTTKLTGVHNCCKSCTKSIDGTVTKAGAKAVIEKDTVTITAADEAGVKKAVSALADAGYFAAGMEAGPALSDVKAKSITVEGPHLCCPKCVDGFNKAAKGAKGVTGTDAKKGATAVVVEGDVSPKELMDALHAAGFNAKVK